MGESVPYSRTEVKALITELRQCGVTISIAHAWQLLRHVGDRKLVIDALLMHKRPTWLESMVGPKEVTGPKEVASPKKVS